MLDAERIHSSNLQIFDTQTSRASISEKACQPAALSSRSPFQLARKPTVHNRGKIQRRLGWYTDWRRQATTLATPYVGQPPGAIARWSNIHAALEETAEAARWKTWGRSCCSIIFSLYHCPLWKDGRVHPWDKGNASASRRTEKSLACCGMSRIAEAPDLVKNLEGGGRKNVRRNLAKLHEFYFNTNEGAKVFNTLPSFLPSFALKAK